MSSHDLTELLRDWPVTPGQVQVRRLVATDGRDLLQVRLPLGVLQMEVSGRPDGAASIVAVLAARLAGHAEATLDGDACAAIRDEIVLLRNRASAFMAVEDTNAALADLAAIEAAIEMSRGRAADVVDRRLAARLRPGILVMQARLEVMQSMRHGGGIGPAVAAVDRAAAEIERTVVRDQLDRELEADRELRALDALRDSLVPKLPSSQRVELEERLRQALAAQNYELAAILRDELRMLG